MEYIVSECRFIGLSHAQIVQQIYVIINYVCGKFFDLPLAKYFYDLSLLPLTFAKRVHILINKRFSSSNAKNDR